MDPTVLLLILLLFACVAIAFLWRELQDEKADTQTLRDELKSLREVESVSPAGAGGPGGRPR